MLPLTTETNRPEVTISLLVFLLSSHSLILWGETKVFHHKNVNGQKVVNKGIGFGHPFKVPISSMGNPKLPFSTKNNRQRNYIWIHILSSRIKRKLWRKSMLNTDYSIFFFLLFILY